MQRVKFLQTAHLTSWTCSSLCLSENEGLKKSWAAQNTVHLFNPCAENPSPNVRDDLLLVNLSLLYIITKYWIQFFINLISLS